MTTPTPRNLRDRCFNCGAPLPSPYPNSSRSSAFCGSFCLKAHRRRRFAEVGFNLLLTSVILSVAAAAVIVDRYQKSQRPEPVPPAPLSGSWTKHDGSRFPATLLRLEGDEVVFLHEGAEVSHPIQDFSDEEQTRIRTLLKAAE